MGEFNEKKTTAPDRSEAETINKDIAFDNEAGMNTRGI